MNRFAALLDRHSRVVWGVCRGLLPNDADAEDVFQATFVALFRGAATIRHTRSLAPWLHSTATRIAKKVRLAAARLAKGIHQQLCRSVIGRRAPLPFFQNRRYYPSREAFCATRDRRIIYLRPE